MVYDILGIYELPHNTMIISPRTISERYRRLVKFPRSAQQFRPNLNLLDQNLGN